MLRQIARGSPGTLWRRIYNVANPGANNDITVPVPAHRYWDLLGVSVTLTADATAGNRLPALSLLDASGVVLAEIVSPTAITANLAPRVSWVPGLGAANVVAASFATMPLPSPCYMGPAESLTITGHTHTGDTWTNCRVTVLEVQQGDPDYIDAIGRGILDHAEAISELIN